MIYDKKYPTVTTQYSTQFTASTENLVAGGLIASDYPAVPYYIGYMPKNTAPDRLFFTHFETPLTEDTYYVATIDKKNLPFAYSGKHLDSATPYSANAYYRYDTASGTWVCNSTTNYYCQVSFINSMLPYFENIGAGIWLNGLLYNEDTGDTATFIILSYSVSPAYYQNLINFSLLLNSYKNGVDITGLRATASRTETFALNLKNFNKNGICDNITYNGGTYKCIFYGINFDNVRFNISGGGYGTYPNNNFLYDYENSYMGKREISFKYSALSSIDYNFSISSFSINKSNNSIVSVSTLAGQYLGGFHFVLSRADVQRTDNVCYRRGNCIFKNSGSTLIVYPLIPVQDIFTLCSCHPCMHKTQNYAYGKSNRYYPVYKDNVFTGEWADGAIDSDLQKLQPWQKYSLDENTFTPDDIPSAAEDEDDTRKRNDQTNLPEIGGIRLVSGTGFSSFYLLSAYHVSELGQLLSQMPSTFWEALGTATDYKMSNLLDYISALKWYPVNVAASAPSLYPDVQVSDIQFGFNGVAKVPLSSTGTSYKLGTVNRVFDMGAVYIPYRGNVQTFLDAEPYTDVYANLPYIGKVQLQANQVVGYTISCYYIIDLITGLATCFLDNGFDTIYTGSGKMGVDISVSGNDIITQSERMSSAYVGTVTHAISNSLSIGGSVAAENPAGTLAGTSNMISGLVADSIATANAKRGVPQVVGGGSGFGSTYANQYPAIIVKRPAVKIPAGYGHSTGYIYNSSVSISMVSGFAVCDDPDLSGISATSAELDMIKNTLTSGFYA